MRNINRSQVCVGLDGGQRARTLFLLPTPGQRAPAHFALSSSAQTSNFKIQNRQKSARRPAPSPTSRPSLCASAGLVAITQVPGRLKTIVCRTLAPAGLAEPIARLPASLRLVAHLPTGRPADGKYIHKTISRAGHSKPLVAPEPVSRRGGAARHEPHCATPPARRKPAGPPAAANRRQVDGQNSRRGRRKLAIKTTHDAGPLARPSARPLCRARSAGCPRGAGGNPFRPVAGPSPRLAPLAASSLRPTKRRDEEEAAAQIELAGRQAGALFLHSAPEPSGRRRRRGGR